MPHLSPVQQTGLFVLTVIGLICMLICLVYAFLAIITYKNRGRFFLIFMGGILCLCLAMMAADENHL